MKILIKKTLKELSFQKLDSKENLFFPNNIFTKLINNLTTDKDKVFT